MKKTCMAKCHLCKLKMQNMSQCISEINAYSQYVLNKSTLCLSSSVLKCGVEENETGKIQSCVESNFYDTKGMESS